MGLLEEFRSFYFYNTRISSDLKFYIFIFLDFVTVSFLHKLFVIVKVKNRLFFWGQGNLIDDDLRLIFYIRQISALLFSLGKKKIPPNCVSQKIRKRPGQGKVLG